MNNCKRCEYLFKKALYDELKNGEASFFEEHLKSCNKCSESFKELKETLSLVKSRVRPEPDENYMANFWNNLEPSLEKKNTLLINWLKDLISYLRFGYSWKYQFAGAVVLIIVGIFIGQLFINNSPVVNNQIAANDENAKMAKLNAEATRYIERSKMIMMSLMNFDPKSDDFETISLSRQKEISKKLLTQANTLSTDLSDPSQQQLKRLISDIQLVLMQIANLDEKYDLTSIELIKDGVNSRGIIMKINIREMQESSKKYEEENKKKINKSNNI
ncbi:MAG TPA: hypothetical protein VKA26_10160 [Ignavibacteriaceae bacterium]|nr:hypothetical protein [Ignavibacteriaceae bacterium]